MSALCCAIAEAGYACKCHALTNAPRTYTPVTVTAEALAEAQRKLEELNLQRDQNLVLTWQLMRPMPFVEPAKDSDAIEARLYHYMGIGPTIKGTFYIPPDPVDPLDVEYDGVKLATLLLVDETLRRDEGYTSRPQPENWRPPAMTPAQRAAVSAHWSAQLRVKVAASAAVDKARAPSVVVDLEDW